VKVKSESNSQFHVGATGVFIYTICTRYKTLDKTGL